MPGRAKSPDIDLYTYRYRCRDLRFAWLGGTAQRFIDLRNPRAGYLAPVTDAKGNVLRQETIDALLRWRKLIEAEKNKAAVEAEARAARIGEFTSPCLPVARASLAGDEAIRTLADDLRNITAREGNVTYRELQQLGWPRETIFALQPQARALASSLEAA